jgi:hypothetical protein
MFLIFRPLATKAAEKFTKMYKEEKQLILALILATRYTVYVEHDIEALPCKRLLQWKRNEYYKF